MMEKNQKATIAPGLEVSRGRDGHWIHFTADTGIHGSFNVEAVFGFGIARGAMIRWIDQHLDEHGVSQEVPSCG